MVTLSPVQREATGYSGRWKSDNHSSTTWPTSHGRPSSRDLQSLQQHGLHPYEQETHLAIHNKVQNNSFQMRLKHPTHHAFKWDGGLQLLVMGQFLLLLVTIVFRVNCFHCCPLFTFTDTHAKNAPPHKRGWEGSITVFHFLNIFSVIDTCLCKHRRSKNQLKESNIFIWLLPLIKLFLDNIFVHPLSDRQCPDILGGS